MEGPGGVAVGHHQQGPGVGVWQQVAEGPGGGAGGHHQQGPSETSSGWHAKEAEDSICDFCGFGFCGSEARGACVAAWDYISQGDDCTV